MPDDRFLHRRAGHSQKVNMLTDLSYRVWTQYMLSADDFGVMRGTHHPIQNDNDHLANRPAKVVKRCLDGLVACGLLRAFEHQGKPYVYQHDWQDWQKVSYPRATNLPAPPAAALSECTPATRRLFTLHPGGAGRTRKEPSGNIPEIVLDSSPLMRAGAPAERLMANGVGERHTANGSGARPPLDVWFQELTSLYPRERVTFGQRTEYAFFEQFEKDPRPAVEVWADMREGLANQIAGHEWRVKGMAPTLEKWLKEGRWRQRHEAIPVSERVSERTSRTLSSAEAFVAEGVKP